MHPDKQQYSCSSCPFVCKSLTDIEIHRQHHKAGAGRSVKCTVCPYFVADKQSVPYQQHKKLIFLLKKLKIKKLIFLLKKIKNNFFFYF